MKKKAILVLLILSYITVSTYAQKDKVDVTYVGNAGFLLNIGNKKILIDALFKGFKGQYNLPQHIQEKLTRAQAPFDNVDLILVTHAHGDHIDLDMVQQHLQNNPKAVFASTQQLVDHMNDSTDRSIGFNPTKEKSDKKENKGITIESFLLPHGPDSRIINNGFLISVNGITFFHTGDVDFDQFTFEEFRSLQLPERKIDLSFIQHFYLTSDSTSRQFVTKGIGGKYIIPIHYHFTTPPFDSTIIRQNYPDVILFKEELQTWKMSQKEIKFSNLRGDYFGQAPPGNIPVVFAPNFISGKGRMHCFPSFSIDNKEIYWQILPPKILTVRQINGEWTNAQAASFSNTANNQAPFIANDNTIYFSSSREGGQGSMDIWHITKKEGKYNEPNSIGTKINTDRMESQPTVSKNRTIFYTGTIQGKLYNKGIYYSIYENGEYKESKLLPEPINLMDTLILDYTPFIAPDESYLLFCSNRQNPEQERCHIYISYKNENGEWGEPVDLSLKMNFKIKSSKFPYISPDGKYLFFSSGDNIYWVSAKIIDDLKTQ